MPSRHWGSSSEQQLTRLKLKINRKPKSNINNMSEGDKDCGETKTGKWVARRAITNGANKEALSKRQRSSKDLKMVRE